MPLAAFCSDFCAASSALPGDVDLGPGGQGLGQPGLGQVDLRGGRVAGLRDLLLLPQRAGPLLLEPGEAGVLQLGQREGGPGRLHSGSGLVDPFLDIVLGQLERLLGPGPVGQGGGGGPPGDLDLDRDLLADAVQVGTLAVQLGERGIELGPRDVDLVAVRDRVDLRHDLPLDDAVVLVGQEPDDPAGDQLRGDVDDVGLDEGVVGDRVAPAVFDPTRSRAAGRRR